MIRSQTRGRLGRLLAVTAVVVATSGCGSSASTQAQSSPGAPVSVTMLQSVRVLSFTPLTVALDKGFFKQQNIDLKYVTLESSGGSRVATEALVAGDAGFADQGSTVVMAAISKGAPLQIVEGTIKMTLEVCASTSFLKSKGITNSSTLEQKMAAFKGQTFGITAAGSADYYAMAYLVKKYASLNPDTDVKFSVVAASALNQSLQQGRIAGYMVSPPTCEQAADAGYGQVIVLPKDVPLFQNYAHEVLATSKSFAQKNPDAVKRIATALAMGNDYALKHPDEAIQIVEKDYPTTKPAIIETAMKNVILPAIIPGGKMDTNMFKALNTVLVDTGGIPQPVDISGDKVFTNKYLGPTNIK